MGRFSVTYVLLVLHIARKHRLVSKYQDAV